MVRRFAALNNALYDKITSFRQSEGGRPVVGMSAFRRSILVVLGLIGRQGSQTRIAEIDACFTDPVLPREPLEDALLALEAAGLVVLARSGRVVIGAQLTPAGEAQVTTRTILRSALMINRRAVADHWPD